MSEEYTIEAKQTQAFPRAGFEVVLKNGDEHQYSVRLSEEYYQKLTQGKITPEQLIERSFRFLLEREPASAILPEFELNLIQHYFSDYEGQMMGGVGSL